MDRLNLTLDIKPNNIGARRVNVRSSLTVANLLVAIQDKFNLDGELAVSLANSSAALAAENPLSQVGVAEGGTLVCTRVPKSTGTSDLIARGERKPFSRKFGRVFVREQSTLTEFDLRYQPAVVGRRDNRDPNRNRLLAVNLDAFEQAHSVSRHHACITEQGGSFYIEDIQGRNPVYVDGKRLSMGKREPLPAGATIRIGGITLLFYLVG